MGAAGIPPPFDAMAKSPNAAPITDGSGVAHSTFVNTAGMIILLSKPQAMHVAMIRAGSVNIKAIPMAMPANIRLRNTV